MGFRSNGSGVSEIIGAMSLLLVFVVVLSEIQSVLVPRWNSEIENAHLEKVYSQFVNMRSDFELVSAKNIPMNSRIDLGERYPDRFMLHNPGPGIVGSLKFDNTSANITIDSNNPLKSSRIIYTMENVPNSPEIVYEHGLIFRNYHTPEGDKQVIDDNTSIEVNGDFYIPIIFTPEETYSGMETKSFKATYLTVNDTIPVNTKITLETKYPEVWKQIVNESNVTVNGSIGYVDITKPGLSLSVPEEKTEDGKILSGTIMKSTAGGSSPKGFSSGDTGTAGTYVVDGTLIDIPTSSNATQFLIEDIQVKNSTASGNRFEFRVTDIYNHEFRIRVRFYTSTRFLDILKFDSSNSNWNPIDSIASPSKNVTDGINLTYYYKSASIGTPNRLKIDSWCKDNDEITCMNILYFKFIIENE